MILVASAEEGGGAPFPRMGTLPPSKIIAPLHPFPLSLSFPSFLHCYLRRLRRITAARSPSALSALRGSLRRKPLPMVLINPSPNRRIAYLGRCPCGQRSVAVWSSGRDKASMKTLGSRSWRDDLTRLGSWASGGSGFSTSRAKSRDLRRRRPSSRAFVVPG